ncbi:acyltransferase [Klebsiella indica]|uniref:acyltransferase n=1 Tax=Klebsiella indica TaxID=2582917 RepID=UPI001485E686|nr:acyltransferase [Klebsiella indica]
MKLVKYLISFLKCCFLQVRYRGRLKINPFKVYISPFANIKIVGNGYIEFKSERDRVYISRNSSFISSNGSIIIGNGVFFNKNVNIVSHSSIVIGDNCLFGHNVCCFDSDHNFSDRSKDIRYQGYSVKPILIKKNVWVGAGTIITKGSTINEHVVIGGNSVVNKNLEAFAVYAGNPCKILKRIL